jgi:hypothetical protein
MRQKKIGLLKTGPVSPEKEKKMEKIPTYPETDSGYCCFREPS